MPPSSRPARSSRVRRHPRAVGLGVGVAAAALLAAGCTKSEQITASVPASSAADTSVVATTTPATDPPSTKGTTSETSEEIDTWTGTNDEDAEFSGDVQCANAGLSFVMTFAMDDADATFEVAFSELGDEEGEFEGYDGDGARSADGAATMSSTFFETEVDDEPGAGLRFELGIAAVDLATDDTNELTLEGSCAIRTAEFGPDPGGGDDSGETGSGSLDLPITDADAFMEALVDVAFPELDPEAIAFGAPVAWEAAGLPASAIEDEDAFATPESISGSRTSVDALGAYEVYAFAIEDTSGACAFGFAYITEDQPKPTARRISTGAVAQYGANQCSGIAALEYFGSDVLD